MLPLIEQASKFKDHEIIDYVQCNTDILNLECWRFQRRATLRYGFTLTIHNGSATVVGDVGFAAITGIQDPRDWLNTTLRDPEDIEKVDWHYLASKAPQELPTREYREEIARKELKDLYESRKDAADNPFTKKQFEKLDKLLQQGDEYLVEVNRELYAHFEPISGQTHACDFMWPWIGVRELLRHLQSQE